MWQILVKKKKKKKVHKLGYAKGCYANALA
jgi:hypothetical protein